MKLIGKETYDRVYHEQDVEEKDCPVFGLKKLSVGDMAIINDAIFIPDGKGELKFLPGTSMKLKVKFGVETWKNIQDDSGNAVPCTDENKEKLPASVVTWLVSQIDELNGIRLLLSAEDRKKLLSL